MELIVKSLDDPDEAREFSKGNDAYVTLGSLHIGRGALQPGWRWSNDIRPVVGTTSCEMPHIGYVLSGVLHVETDDGASVDLKAGDAFTIPAGHDAWVVGDEPAVMLDWNDDTHLYALSPDEVAARTAVTS